MIDDYKSKASSKAVLPRHAQKVQFIFVEDNRKANEKQYTYYGH